MADTIYNDPSSGVNAAVLSPQARPDKVDWDIVVAGIGGTGVLSGLQVQPQGSPNRTVQVAGGVVQTGLTAASVAPNPSVSINAADATNPRRDLIYVNSSNVIAYAAGTAAATPDIPSIPAGGIALAIVDMPANATQVDSTASTATGKVTDKRVFLQPSGIGPGFVNVVAEGADPSGTTDSTSKIQAAIALIATNGGVVYFPPGNYRISGTLVIPSNSWFRGSGVGVTIIQTTNTFYGDVIAGTSCAPISYTPSNGDQYQFVTDLEIQGPFTAGSNLNVYHASWIGANSQTGSWPQSASVYGDPGLSGTNVFGQGTGWLSGGGYFYSGGKIWVYTGITTLTAATQAAPYPLYLLTGCQPASGNNGTLTKNNWCVPATNTGAGVRLQGTHNMIANVWTNATNGDGMIVQNDTSGDTGDNTLWHLQGNHAGTYGITNFNVSDSRGGDWVTNGCGWGGAFIYSSDFIVNTMHLTNGPTSSAFTPGFVSGGNRNQQIIGLASDSMYGGGLLIDNARHAGNATENLTLVSCHDIIGVNNDWINFANPFVSIATQGAAQDIDMIGVKSGQPRFAQASSTPAAQQWNTLNNPLGSVFYFIDLLPFVVSADGTTAGLTITDSTGAQKGFPTTQTASVQCAMAVAPSIKVQPAGTVGHITLTARSTTYGFYTDFVPLVTGTGGAPSSGAQTVAGISSSGLVNMKSNGYKAIPTTRGTVSIPTTSPTGTAVIYYTGASVGADALTGCTVLSGSGTIADGSTITPNALVLVPDPKTNNPVPFYLTSVTSNGTVLNGVWGDSTVISGSASVTSGEVSQGFISLQAPYGDNANDIYGLTANISNATWAASVTTITTDRRHGFTVGEAVNVVGIQGAASVANNTGQKQWTVASVSSNAFNFTGINTTFSGYTAATGVVIGSGGINTIAYQQSYLTQFTTSVNWNAWQSQLNQTNTYVYQPIGSPGLSAGVGDQWTWSYAAATPTLTNSLIGASVTQPAFPASGTTITNTTGYDCDVYVAADGQSVSIAIGGTTAASIAAATTSLVRVPNGQTITPTYGGSPNWTWFGG